MHNEGVIILFVFCMIYDTYSLLKYKNPYKYLCVAFRTQQGNG